MRRALTSITSVLPLVLSLAACTKSDERAPGAAPAAAAKPAAGNHACTALIGKASTSLPVEAMASGADEAKAEADAWTQACAKLPPEAKAGCAPGKAPDGWTWSAGGGGI